MTSSPRRGPGRSTSCSPVASASCGRCWRVGPPGHRRLRRGPAGAAMRWSERARIRRPPSRGCSRVTSSAPGQKRARRPGPALGRRTRARPSSPWPARSLADPARGGVPRPGWVRRHVLGRRSPRPSTSASTRSRAILQRLRREPRVDEPTGGKADGRRTDEGPGPPSRRRSRTSTSSGPSWARDQRLETGFGPTFRRNLASETLVTGLERFPGVGWPHVRTALSSPAIRPGTWHCAPWLARGPEAWPEDVRPALTAALLCLSPTTTSGSESNGSCPGRLWKLH